MENITPKGFPIYSTLCCILFLCISSTLSAQALSCLNEVNISLDGNCMSQLEPEDILSHGNTTGPYTLELTTATSTVVPNNLIDENYLLTTLTARVTDAINNVCWGLVNVEDKLGPDITCTNLVIDCFEMQNFEPTAVDACSDATVSVIGNSIRNLVCDNNFVAEVTQTYRAEDGYGNVSSCSQTIMLRKFDTSAVDFPDDFAIADNTNLTCIDPLNAEGFPAVTATGVPTVDGVPIYPLTDQFCNISVEFSDFEVIAFGCARKIMRTWRINEFTCNGGDDINHVQLLEIQDTELPTITNCPSALMYNADGGCDREVELQLPTATDDCSGVLEIDVVYEGGFANNATENPVVVLSGSSTVTYTVYDNCDNSASCTTLITIQDEFSPTSVCDQNSVVSLRADGTATALIGTFDDGSFDDCNFYTSLVRRVGDSSCDCTVPNFDDLTFLGEHNGGLYYLSDNPTIAPWARDRAVAFGGELVSFNTQAEADWIVASALAITDSVYLGLTYDASLGQFLWPNHVAPIFTDWASGQVDVDSNPLVAGNYVILNELGQWEIVQGAEQFRYIVELPNGCGFSSRVNFCCDDVGTQQQVVLRVIDASGRSNDCISNVTVQDKVAPVIVCPQDLTLTCDQTIDPNDPTFGVATATDQCTSNITSQISNNVDPTCGVGVILKVWTAADDNGSTSCTQTFNIVATNGFNSNEIIWPLDFEAESACDNSVFQPNLLEADFAYPRFTESSCDNVTTTFDDADFSFAGPGSDACSKIIRTWTVTNNCEPIQSGVNPAIHQQAISVNNNVAPTISGLSSQTLVVNSNNCQPAMVTFSATALDDCAPMNQVTGVLLVDNFLDNTVDMTINSTGNVIHFNQTLPLGFHDALVSFSDRCGNTSSFTQRIHVQNVTTPTVACKNSVSVNIQSMDIDSDASTPDVLMAPVNPAVLIASVDNPCNFTLNSSFSATDNNDRERIFTCDDVGQSVSTTVYLEDSFGFSSSCTGLIVIQDNNNLCGDNGTPNVLSLTGCGLLQLADVSCNADQANVDFEIIASSSNCASSLVNYTIQLDYNSDNSFDFTDSGSSTGGFVFSRNFPEGIHTASISVTDNCGAVQTCTKQIEISCFEDSSGGDIGTGGGTGTGGTDTVITGCEPELFDSHDCRFSLQFDMDIVNSNCGLDGGLLFIARVDFGADGSVDFREDIVDNSTYSYNFPTPPGAHSIELTVTDPCGTVTVCTKPFSVICVSPVLNARLAGRIYTEEEIAVEQVEVQLEGAYTEVQVTEEDGAFAFPLMSTGNDYRISPFKDNDPLNGISTLDLVLIQRNILGIELLDSPYKLIAADVDNSGNVNGIDLVELRKLILGIYDHFPKNSSWKMVDAEYTFADVTNPFLNDIPENYVVSNLSEDMNVDFIGVKIGDVNNTVQLAGRSVVSGRSIQSYELICDDKKLIAGEETDLVFRTNEAEGIFGAQLELLFDLGKAELLAVEPLAHDMGQSNFNTNRIDEGKFLMSWNSTRTTQEAQELFKVTILPHEDGFVHDLVQLTSTTFAQEAYIDNSAVRLTLNFNSTAEMLNDGVVLYQNTPNPWTDYTEIKYYLPRNKDIVLSLYDINGKLIYREQKNAKKGFNKVILSNQELNNGGVFYYELQAENTRYVQKMIHID